MYLKLKAMKKTLSLISAVLLSAQSFSQTTIYAELPPLTSAGTTNQRAPNGTTAHTTFRGHFIIPASEVSGIVNGTQITNMGFVYSNGASSVATGTITFYLENTANTTNTKSTTWATAIAAMTPVYNGTLVIPSGTGTAAVSDVVLGTPFAYTGGGIYVAYDWQGATFAVTGAINQADASLAGSTFSGASATTTPPATLGGTASAFRPQVRFGYLNPNSNDMAVLAINARGHENMLFGTSQNITAVLRNSSNTTLNNINVNLTVTGANPTTSLTVIPTLTAGATTTLTFSGLPVTASGGQQIKVEVPADQVTTNDFRTYDQIISCDTLGYSNNTAPFDGIGFNTGSGLMLTKMTAPSQPITIKGVNVGIATATTSIGKTVYGVAVAKNGTILATTPTVALVAGDIGKDKVFTFGTSVNIAADSVFFVGLAQTASILAGYFPVGTQVPNNIPAGEVYTMPLAGGTTASQTTYTDLGRLMIEAIIAGKPVLTGDAPTGMVCSGLPVTYTVNTGYTNYSFSNNGSVAQNSASNSYSFTVTAPATVQATTIYNTCTMTTNSLTIGLAPVSVTVNASASTPSACPMQTITLTATGATSYTWMPGGAVTSSISSVSPVITSPPGTTVTYTVQGTNGCGVATQTVSYYANPAPLINVSPASATVCAGQSVTLTASSSPNYTWTPSGQPSTVLSTSPSLVITPTVSGSYMVVGTYGGNCFGAASASVTVNTCTGIDEASALSGISIYPNPNQGEVNISLSTGVTGNYSIKIFDALGKLVMEEKLDATHTTIQTAKLEAGIYMYKVYQGAETLSVGRMVKQ